MYKIYKNVETWDEDNYLIVDCYSNQYFHSSLTKFGNSVIGYSDYTHKCLESNKQYVYLGECKYRKEVLLTLPMLDLLADV